MIYNIPISTAELNSHLVKGLEKIEYHAIFLLNTIGTIISWNKQAEKITGYSQNEVLKRKNIADLYPLDKKPHIAHLLISLRNDSDTIYTDNQVNKNGTAFPSRLCLIRSSASIVTCVVQDLSEKNQLEENYKRDKKVFIDKIHDQVFNPLNSINIAAQLLSGYLSYLKKFFIEPNLAEKLQTFLAHPKQLSQAQSYLLAPEEQDSLAFSRNHISSSLVEINVMQLIFGLRDAKKNARAILNSAAQQHDNVLQLTDTSCRKQLLSSRSLSFPPQQTQGSSVRILVVDDNGINYKIIKNFLKQLGYENVTTANNGRLAVTIYQEAIIEKNPFSLIFMDIMMPELDGLDATRKIRALGATIPIIGLSAQSGDDDRNEALAAGMNNYLTKPTSKDKIEEILRISLKKI